MGAQMSIKAMKQALKALEQHGTPLLNHEDAYSESLTALRQAIAEAEKQEPVAWSYTNAQGRDVIIRGNVAPYEAPYEDATPLYTHPLKREWVSLTDDDIYSADCVKQKYIGSGEYVIDSDSVEAFARAIEAKLREKNGC
jgi:hypothetical protein